VAASLGGIGSRESSKEGKSKLHVDCGRRLNRLMGMLVESENREISAEVDSAKRY
jgi:hypothetical protein